jgi:membrane protein YqaA with SNARE-associated domain
MLTYLVTFAKDFIGIFFAMALFFAPFVALFWWRNREIIRQKKPHFNYFMERFFLSHEADALVFCWAAAEAIAWFIIPEFLLFLVIFMRIHRKFDLLKYDLLGTIAGSIVAILWRLPQSVFLHLPYIRPKMISQVQTWYQQHGIWGLLYQPFSGVPYKVFTHEAVNYHFFIPAFLVIAIVARMVRYLVVYEAVRAGYPLLHAFVRRHYVLLFLCATVIFTALLIRVVQLYA